MRAAVYQGLGLPHKIETVAEPIPNPHEVIIRVERCGICGSDVSMTKPISDDSTLDSYIEQLFKPGAILGHEISGEVVALGPKVEHLRVGDRIAPMFLAGCGSCRDCLSGKPNWCPGAYGRMGGYAEYATANENFCVRLGTGLTSDLGALIEPLATSYHAVALAKMQPGSKVLITGAGAIGLGIAYFARKLGAERVAVLARTNRRSDLASDLGATAFFAQSPGVDEAIVEHLGGPPDVVFEAAGVPGIVNQAIALVRPAGLVVVAGITMQADPILHAAAMMKELRIQYAMAYELDDFRITAGYLREPDTPFASLITQSVSLDDFPAMFETLHHGADQCKVVVNPFGS